MMMGALLLTSTASAQILSPGDLSRPHESLDSLRTCSKCHESGRRLSGAVCLSCHKELATRVDKGKGFHGRMPATERDECQSCHHEHQGKSFAIISWNEKKFEHSRAGYPLHGKHATLECKGCHDPKRLVAEDVKTMLEEHPQARTFLGLPTTCAACHEDPHAAKLGTSCSQCHSETNWRVRSGFDHAKTVFPLLGKHAAVSCEKCHKGVDPAVPSKLDPAFPAVPHAQCTNCHDDPHDRRFGATCTGCHTMQGWHVLNKDAKERAFHEKTQFPLQGAHSAVACVACHGPFGRGKPAKFKGLAFKECSACHLDAHGGQLAKTTCDQCHTVDSFAPPRFALADHRSFPLEGAHAAVGCNECHRATFKPKKQPAASNGKVFTASAVDFHPQHGACESCHKDPHDKQFAPKTCDGCHTTQRFSQLNFDHDKDTAFALTGHHSNAPCAGCHVKTKGPIRYDRTPDTCNACHRDAHYGQLGARCEQCHTTKAFAEVTFDHGKTAFALDGKHKKVACLSCHPKIEVKPGLMVQRFKPTPTTCAGCHTDPHGGEFKRFKP